MAATAVKIRVSRAQSGRPGPAGGGDRGYSVIELLAGLLIFSILLTVAVPSYQRYSWRMHRAAAVRQLLATAACQERVRAATGWYDTTRCSPEDENPRYSFRVDPGRETQSLEFELFADPVGETRDDSCGSLSLDQAGTRSVSGQAAASTCWGGR